VTPPDYRILFPDREMERWPRVPKLALARRIVRLVEEFTAAK